MTRRLELKLLGKPQVHLDGQTITGFRTAKAEALFYFLAVTGRFYSRETLVDLLWGEMPEAKAKRNLTQILSLLRKQFQSYLLIEPQHIGFQPEADFWLDVVEFERLTLQSADAKNASERLRQAVELYQGDFLQGFFVKEVFSFEEWALTERERLRELMLQALQTLVSEAIRQAEYAAGLNDAGRLLALEPWHETAHRQLMLLLARTGRREAALAQYETCRHILAEELGVEPMAETTALYERLKAAGRSPSRTLPPPPNALVGRETELQHLERYLADPTCRLVTITGLGGIGKTRLAIAAAHQVNQESALLFINGVAFVSLAGVTEAASVPLSLANGLDVPLSGTVSPRHALLNFLRHQEMLLVLDNFEQLTGAIEFLLELLQSCPAVKLLVTSREPLNLAAEWRLDLEGLPVPPDEENDVATLQNYAAGALFVRSASQVNLDFHLSEKNVAVVGRLCRLVAGMPLALQLAATWLRAMSVTAILAALERDLDILATEMHDIPPRQRSMRAVFESTWLLLTAKEQQVVETLSVCRGGFTQEAAAEIAKATPFLLRRIIDRALIYQQGEFRYGMHPLTQQFAQEQLKEDERETAAAADHGRYYLSWLASLEPALHGLTPRTTISAIKEELDNLQQAWEWATQARQTELLLRSLAALTTFYDLVGLLQEGETLVESTLSHLGQAAGHDEALLLCQLLIAKGRFVSAQGLYEPADETLARALELAQRLRHAESVADVHDLRGRILTDTGVYAGAKQQYWHALNTYRQLSNDRKTARTLTDLGWTHIIDDDVDAALPILQEALALERKADHKRGKAYVLGNMAVVYGIKGELQQALANQQEVLAAYEALGDLLNLERTENNIGMTLLGIGRYDEALPHMQRAVDLARQLEVLPGLANALDSLGTAYLACGEYAKAKACLDEALDLALEIGYMYMNYSVRAVLVRLFNRTGDLAQAQQQLQQLRVLAETAENAAYIARALIEQAHLTYLQGDLSEATKLAAQAIAVLRQNPAPLDLPFVLLQHADYLREQQRPAEALPLVQEALTAAQHLQHESLQMRASALAADLSVRLDEAEAAHAYAEAAHLLLSQLEPYPDTLEGVLHLGRYQLARGNQEAAAKIGTFVANHPASTYGVCRHAEALLEEIAGHSLQIAANREPPDWPGLVSYLTKKEISDNGN